MDIPVNADVYCNDQRCGVSTYIIVNPTTKKITHLVVKEKGFPHTERLVPIDVTNLAISTPTTFSLPLDLSSLHNLNQTFRRIHAHLEKECRDDTAGNEQPTSEQYYSAPGMGDLDRRATTNNSANDRQGLPKSGNSVEAGGQS